ncbi:endolytic transglycosylase MltG [Helicobacter trogontum]|uniref:endolytic transglycosylase MltG n=1 Tax=Helicobacter trogontum TaxID=50960 RepID=UPI001F1FCF48|nr:endolytic transglycosylase MltG [Helicobacter trogontum]
MLFELFLILFLGACFYLSIPIYSEKIIYIPKGSTRSIITHLQHKGYNVSLIDTYFLRLIGRPQSGWIELPQQTLSKGQFLNALATSKAPMKNVTLIPGETNYFFLRQIAKTFNFSVSELETLYNKYAPYSDGVILANTYSLPYHADPDFIMQTLINQSLEKHKLLAIKFIGHYDKEQWFQIIAKASIIQKEAANVAEMPIVSSVIDNRIAKKMPLQMDGSLNYGKYSHTRITPDRIRNDLSEFNTYKHSGIPRTPSGSVSVEAIQAAINPANTNYLYFMRNKSGTHDFSATYTEHLKNIKKVKN